MKRTWIKNARIVNEGKTFHGSIVIENDRIAEVIADGTLPLHPCDEEIDAGGCYLDVLVMAAAVADYRPAAVADDKIKKKDGDLSIAVERTPDILGTIGPKKKGQFLCGFSMETRDMLANSSAKLEKKNLDMVVANNLKVAGAGFGVDTNVVTFITPDGARELPLMSKDDVADAILDEILARKSK